MVINNVNLVDSDAPVNISVSNGKIAGVSHAAFTSEADPFQWNMNNALAFPGLINSHDHLDFNLYPQLGDRHYNNYTEWGKHIHANYKKEIADIQKIPFALRHAWGIYKNLLCGVTTVISHGEKTGFKNDLITVFEDSHCLHSVQFEKHWKWRLNNPLKAKQPVNIHIGEGDDWLAYHEIDELLRFNLLQRKLIGTHAVAMSAEQAENFEAIIWCLESNYFLLNKTARVDVLKDYTRILFGTDSTLTGSWDIWKHLRLARKANLISDKLLYESLTGVAASVWKLNSGSINEGKDADIVVARIPEKRKMLDAFFSITPADILLVLHQGEIRLFDAALLPELKGIEPDNYSCVLVNNSCKYVEGDLQGLVDKIKACNNSINFPITLKQL